MNRRLPRLPEWLRPDRDTIEVLLLLAIFLTAILLGRWM